MTSLYLDQPVPPNAFAGRQGQMQQVVSRLLPPDVLNTGIVGGPRTGKTSLLRYLASPDALALYPQLASFITCNIDGADAATPDIFWERCLRVAAGRTQDLGLRSKVEDVLQRGVGTLDVFDLEDVFDAFAKAGTPVVLLIDDFHTVIANESFWPPSNFFHTVRALGRHQPRGLAFVLASPRPLQDLWKPTANASPFYNIFTDVAIGRLEEDEVRELLRGGFSALGLPADPAVEEFVVVASARHPFMATYVAHLCTNLRRDGRAITQDAVAQAFRDPGGPVVSLIREIRTVLSPNERTWVDAMGTSPASVNDSQRAILRKIGEYGLLPPGTALV